MDTSIHSWGPFPKVTTQVRKPNADTGVEAVLTIRHGGADFTWYATDAELIDLRDKLIEHYPVEAPEPEHEHEHRPMGSIVSDAVGRRFADCACGQRIRTLTSSVYADWKPVREFLGVPFP